MNRLARIIVFGSIGLIVVALSISLISRLTAPEPKVVHESITADAASELDAAGQWNGSRIEIENKNTFAWTNVELDFNGAICKAGTIPASKTTYIDRSYFKTSSGEPYDIVHIESAVLRIKADEGETVLKWRKQ